MVRRSKEDALATRNRLLDAAERVFLAKGVAGTSLNDIALEAGTTRGAIYWHFKDKADLFNAMMDRVIMPLQLAMECNDAAGDGDPLPRLREGLRAAMHRMMVDAQTRRVLAVATHMVEYVDSLCAVRERHLHMRKRSIDAFRAALAASAARRGIALRIPAPAAAKGLHGLVAGLIQDWLLEPDSFDLEACGMQAVESYLHGLGLD